MHYDLAAENATQLGKGVTASAVKCAVLMPHAPVLVPAVGRERGAVASASCQAMRTAAGRVLSSQPDSVVIISPHAPRKSGAFGLWTGDLIEGSFGQFGAPQAKASLPNDLPLVHAIAAAAHSRQVPTWFISGQSLDHGALVPIWFLIEAGWTGTTVVLSLNSPGEGGLPRFGQAISAAAEALDRRIAIVASGDMSHRLTRDAPCGFHPKACRFDEAFVGLLRAGDYRSIPDIDSELREAAAEDAADAAVIAAAAVGWNPAGHEVLNYEGPFGVGYGVAILFAPAADPVTAGPLLAGTSKSVGRVLPEIARQSVAAGFRGYPESVPARAGEYLNQASGVFVTIRRRSGTLRGCVGTLEPACTDLVSETWRNARLAAFQDERFPQVEADELEDLHFEVSVLHVPEEIFSPDQLDPQHYGVIVSTADDRRGVLLPGIPEIKTAKQMLGLAREKACIGPEEPIRIERFEVDHFEESQRT